LFWSIILGVSYTQAPLYYSNQNQYFLHGLAQAGVGFLDHDWLAGTRDPTPIFTALVTFIERWLHKDAFYVLYILIFGLYAHALSGIFSEVTGKPRTSPAGLAFLSLLVFLHSGLIRWCSATWFGVDYPWFLQAGVAGQYVLGFGLQPSVFGVLLLEAIHAFLRDRRFSAATWAALAGIIHATYLLSAAFLVLAFMFALVRRGRWPAALAAGAWALLLVLPMVIYNSLSFAPTSPQTFAEAQRILVHFRIPHHAVVERWLDPLAMLQVVWILTSFVLVWRQPVFLVLVLPFVFALALTLAQVATGSDTLALLFPWRTSALLVPAATAIILARLVNLLAPAIERRFPQPTWKSWTTLGLPMLASVAGGIAISISGLGYRSNPDEMELLDFVRRNKKEGDVYLLSVDWPKATSGKRGVFSTNFTPAPRRGRDAHLIAVDFQGFRLATGAPIYVDFKSIPYQDAEVLEWQRRLFWVADVYDRLLRNDPKVPEVLAKAGISHLVTTVHADIHLPRLEKIYEDANYRLYRLRP
jgi:uncharacterized protein DUF6798